MWEKRLIFFIVKLEITIRLNFTHLTKSWKEKGFINPPNRTFTKHKNIGNYAVSLLMTKKNLTSFEKLSLVSNECSIAYGVKLIYFCNYYLNVRTTIILLSICNYYK